MKRVSSIALIAVGIVLLAASPGWAQFDVDGSVSIEPVSIPFDSAGDGPSKVGITTLGIAEQSNNASEWEIYEMTLTLTGTIVPADVAEIYVYWEEQSTAAQDGTYDRGTNGEVEIGTLTNALLTKSWSGNTIDFPIPVDNRFVKKQAGNGQGILHIAMDFVNGVTSSKTAGVQVSNIDYGTYNAGGLPVSNLGTLAGPWPGSASNTEVDDYAVTLTGDTSSIPPGAYPGDTATILQLDFDIADSSLLAAGHTTVSSIRLHQIGTGDENDVATDGVRVFTDVDSSGDFSAGDIEHGIGTLGADGYVTVVLSTNPLTLGSTTLQYLVAIDIDSNAVENHTLGFEVEDPSADVTSTDSFVDIQEAAYLTSLFSVTTNNQSFEYLQNGYIVSTATTPAAADTLTIQAAPDVTPPTVVEPTTPANLATGVSRTTGVSVTFSEPMLPVDASDLTVVGTTSGPIDTTSDGTFVFNTTSNQSFTFTKTDPYAYGETVTVTVSGTVTDDAAVPNAMGSDFVFSFTIEPETPPEVTDTTPNDGALGVARNTTIEIVFSEAMDLATLIEANFSMTDEAATTVSGTFGVTGDRTVTFVPDALLDYDTTYTVTLASSNIFDQEDSTLADWTGATHPYSFSFRTVPNVPPTVLATIPADGVTDASIGTTVSVVFSEPMDETSVLDDANFSLIETGETDEVSGMLTYTAEANTLSFTPDMAFSYSTEYTGTVTTGVTDADGTPIGEDYTFTFTTASAADSLSFTDIIVANNRIEPGSSEPMRIFLEVPDSVNGTDAVTIAVYTTNGRRVATLTTAGETYDDVIARQPIIWDGTNGRGQNLGPGLYFVQVSSAGYRRALRVMIVR